MRFRRSSTLRPRPHVYVFMRKRRFSVRFRLPSTRKRLFSVFESLRFPRKRRFSKTGLKVETFENGDFRKRWLSCGRAKTETFENGVDLKTHRCGRGLIRWKTDTLNPRKRRLSKTSSKVETFENGCLSY